MVSLNTEIANEGVASPYWGNLDAVGFFYIEPIEGDKEEKKLLKIVGANAPAILYSASRELYLFLAGRGPWLPLQWPTVHFADQELTSVGKDGEEEGHKATTNTGSDTEK